MEHDRARHLRIEAMQTLPYFVNSFGDRYLYDVNRNTFNQVGAANVFKRRYGERLFDKDSLTIVVGTDSGLLLKHVLEHDAPEGSRFLFFELDALLSTVESEIDSAALDETVVLSGQRPLVELLKQIRFSDYANINAVRLIESLGATDDFHGDYRDLVASVSQQLDAIRWAHSVGMSNPTFLRRQLQNLVEMHQPASALSDSFRGKTAALLGGGPSLDELLPWIRDHQQDLVVIAVSRICRRLREADVTPHVVVSIDPTELSFDISKELLELDSRVLFAHANHAAYPLLAQWHGRSVYLDRQFPWERKDEPANIGTAGPTVTNTGFALARAMGFRTILFAGIDMCHSIEGYSHASGSNEFDAGPMFGNASVRVTTNDGRLAETTPDFLNAVQSFGLQALNAREQGIDIINPAAGAAVIDGVRHVPLRDLDLEPLDGDPFAILHARLGDATPARRCDSLRATKHELARAHDRLRSIVKLAEEALACNDGLFGRDGKQADFKHKRRMDKIEHQLDTRHSTFSSIVKMFSAEAFLRMPPSDREWTDDEIEQAGKTYYNAYLNNANAILALVEAAQRRIDMAVEEEQTDPDISALLQHWEQDGIPGRARIWCQRHPERAAALDAVTRRRFDTLDAAFRSTLQARETRHAQKVRGEASLEPIRGKLLTMYRARDAQELTRMAEQLAKLDDSDAEQLRRLALGYRAELDADHETAFEHYAALIDLTREQLARQDETAPNPCLEDALRRMVVVALAESWHDQALLVLETLADISAAYQPQFAELLRLTGHTDAAANVYTAYLTQVPDDHVAMLRLGKLYQSAGALDAARTAFTYILDKDPDNKAARSLLDEIDTAA